MENGGKMTTQFIVIEGVIPASGEMDKDHDLMVEIKPAIDELKKVVHKLGGSLTVKPVRKKAPNNTAPIPATDAPVVKPIAMTTKPT